MMDDQWMPVTMHQPGNYVTIGEFATEDGRVHYDFWIDDGDEEDLGYGIDGELTRQQLAHIARALEGAFKAGQKRGERAARSRIADALGITEMTYVERGQ